MTDAAKTRTTGNAGKMRKTALALALLAGTTLGGFTAGHLAFAATDDATATPPAAPVNTGVAVPQQTLPDFSDLVTKVKPAVVSITTKLEVHQTADDSDGRWKCASAR